MSVIDTIISHSGDLDDSIAQGHQDRILKEIAAAVANLKPTDPFIFISNPTVETKAEIPEEGALQVMVSAPQDFIIEAFAALGHQCGVPGHIMDSIVQKLVELSVARSLVASLRGMQHTHDENCVACAEPENKQPI